MDFFRETTFRPLGVLRPKIFTCARDSPRLASAHPKWGGSPKNNISKIGKVLYHPQPLPRWTKKVGVLWSTDVTVIDSNIFRP